MRATADTEGSDFDTVLAVYTGDTVEALSRVASVNVQGLSGDQVAFDAIGGTTYHIAIDSSAYAESGHITLNLHRTPPNDDFADAQVVPGEGATVTGTNVGATSETGETYQGGKSVWYEWTPNTTGTAVLDYSESGFAPVIGVSTGSQVNSLSWVYTSSSGYNTWNFAVAPGTTYHIRVCGYWNEEIRRAISGNFALKFSVIPDVSITSPSTSYQRGTITIAADVTYSRGVDEVVFSLAGTEGTYNDIGRDAEPPYETTLDTTSLEDGYYYLKATAIASPDIQGSDYLGFHIDNTAPTVVKVRPIVGAKGVGLKTNVKAYFSEDMNAAAVTARDQTTGKPTTFTLRRKTATGLGAPIAAKVTYAYTYEGYRTVYRAVLNPSTDLRYGATYVATVTTEAKDAAGNALGQKKVWTFHTKRR